MGQGGILTNLHTGFAREAQLVVGGCDQISNLLLGHAFTQSLVDGFIGGQRHLRGETHESNFVRSFYHAATGGYRSRAGDGGLRRGFNDSIEKNETDGFFNPKLAGGQAVVLESLRNKLIRVLVLLPGSYIGMLPIRGVSYLLTGASFLECREQIRSGTPGGQNEREQSCAPPPVDAGEVFQRGTLHKNDRIEVLFIHQLTSPLLPFVAFLPRDRSGFVFSRLQVRDGFR